MPGFSRTLRRRVLPHFTRALARLAGRVAPRLYRGYMRLVFMTSRLEIQGVDVLKDLIRKHGGVVILVWHQEIVTAIYMYYHVGLRPSTLASSSDAGDVITRVLEPMNYVIFRGGSYRRKSGQTTSVLDPMVEHMQNGKDVLFGLTVDGPQGPPYRIKRGGIVIAQTCDKPLVVQRTWHKRYLSWKSWDALAFPLPFNVITSELRGPWFVPESARTPEQLEQFIEQLEDELIDLTVASHRRFGEPIPKALVKRSETRMPAA